jgi:hypothetical protein
MECFQIQLAVDTILASGNAAVARYTERGKSVRTFRDSARRTLHRKSDRTWCSWTADRRQSVRKYNGR